MSTILDEKKYYSTDEYLKDHMPQTILPGFSAEEMYEMEKKIAKNMEEFRLQANIRRAKAIEDLSKLYITI